MRITVLIAACLCAAWPAQGATYHVATSGADTNPGTEAAPWATLQRAADVMQAGDTTLVAEGVYPKRPVTKRHGRADARITFRATGRAQAGGGFQVDHNFVTVDGFEITPLPGAARDAMWPGALQAGRTSESVHFLNCNLRDLPEGVYGVLFRNNVLTPVPGSASCIVSNCTFRNSRQHMLAVNGSGHLIIHCTFDKSNSSDAIRIWGKDHRITGCTFQDISPTPGSGGHPDVLQTFGNNRIECYNVMFDNNIIRDCGGQILMASQDGVQNIRDITFYNNLFLRIAAQANCSAPGIKWYNNTFFDTCKVGTVLSIGSSIRNGVDMGSGHKAEVFNNIFFRCGTGDAANINHGWYSIGTNLVGCVNDHNFVCGAGYGPKRQGCPSRPYYFCEEHGINGGNPGFIDEKNPGLGVRDDSMLKGRGKVIPGLHTGGPVDIGARLTPRADAPPPQSAAEK